MLYKRIISHSQLVPLSGARAAGVRTARASYQASRSCPPFQVKRFQYKLEGSAQDDGFDHDSAPEGRHGNSWRPKAIVVISALAIDAASAD